MIALFLTYGEKSTLTRKMFSSLREDMDPTMAAVSGLLILGTVALIALAAMPWSRHFGRRRG